MRKVIVGNSGVIVSSGKAHYIDAIPDGYTRLQYISASGRSVLDTEILVDQSDTIILTYELTNLSQGGDKFMISCQQGYSGGGIWVETYDSYNRWYVRFGSPSSVNDASQQRHLNGVHTFEVRKNYFGVDGERVLTPSYSSMPSKPLDIGGRLGSDGVSPVGGFYGRIYGAKILDTNGKPRWWGVPVKNQNNVAGMYDLVSDSFFPSNTTTDFTAGPVAQ